MAGGVLLFPDGAENDQIETGLACSAALGLQHFVTWSSQEITFWNTFGGTPSSQRTLPLGRRASTSEFRQALTAIIRELKLLSVTGAIPPAQLSSHYLANLCLGALRAGAPFLEETHRVARSQELLAGGNRTSPPIATEAARKGMMSLVRLLALVFHDRLPDNVQPEGLERAMRFSVDTLPSEVREELKFSSAELPLPPESAVRYHHLFRRLGQLRCGEDRQRAGRVLELLQEHGASSLGGHPLPFPPAASDAGPTLLVNPDRLYPHGGELVEVAPPPILAFNTLLRNLQGLPPARAQGSDLFALGTIPEPKTVIGALTNSAPPKRESRPTLTAMLRASWPTRRFGLPAGSPCWVWELLHLLGIAAEGASLGLDLSDQWLTADFGIPIADLLKEQFTLELLERSAENRVRMRLIKGVLPEKATFFIGPDGPREIPRERLRNEHRSFFPLALTLPEPLFRLLEEGALRIPREGNVPQARQEELRLFLQSTLARYLGAVLGKSPVSLVRAGNLPKGILPSGMPLPSEEILKDLASLSGGSRTAGRVEIDALLANRLGVDLATAAPAGDLSGRRTPAASSAKISPESEAAEKIVQEVFVDGLPHFPEQYLYDYYRPPLREYTFTGPLTLEDEFFGKVALCDSMGEALQVEGGETARALLLVSHSGRTAVSLPEDRGLTAAILERYLKDLELLRSNLARATHIRIPDPKAADSLVCKIWESLSLPPGIWSRAENAQFPGALFLFPGKVVT